VTENKVTEKTVFHRSYRYLVRAGVALAVDVSKEGGRIAVTACNITDNFSRKTARFILDALLDQPDETLRALQLQRNVYRIPYIRAFSRTEIIHPLLDLIGDNLNERALFRVLRELFSYNAVTEKAAAQAADFYKNPRLKDLYKQVVSELDKEEVGALARIKNFSAFDRYFFDWRGSAEAVFNGVSTFAQLLFQEMELKSEINALDKQIADLEKEKDEDTKKQLEGLREERELLGKVYQNTCKATGAALRDKPKEKKPKTDQVKTLPRKSAEKKETFPPTPAADVAAKLRTVPTLSSLNLPEACRARLAQQAIYTIKDLAKLTEAEVATAVGSEFITPIKARLKAFELCLKADQADEAITPATTHPTTSDEFLGQVAED